MQDTGSPTQDKTPREFLGGWWRGIPEHLWNGHEEHPGFSKQGGSRHEPWSLNQQDPWPSPSFTWGQNIWVRILTSGFHLHPCWSLVHRKALNWWSKGAPLNFAVFLKSCIIILTNTPKTKGNFATLMFGFEVDTAWYGYLKHLKTTVNFRYKNFWSQAWWCAPVNPAVWEAKAEGWQVWAQSSQLTSLANPVSKNKEVQGCDSVKRSQAPSPVPQNTTKQHLVTYKCRLNKKIYRHIKNQNIH